MQRLKVSGAVRHIYIYVIRRLKVKLQFLMAIHAYVLYIAWAQRACFKAWVHQARKDSNLNTSIHASLVSVFYTTMAQRGVETCSSS
jgi:hypothetical protein